MNFLSHYYFDRHSLSSEQVVGSILPDLVRNADKGAHIKVEKKKDILLQDPKNALFYKGWVRHIEVDRHFHNASYFLHHTQAIKQELLSAFSELPIRLSFFSHIALELLLDYQLIKHKQVDVASFYAHLKNINPADLADFFAVNQYEGEALFFAHYEDFIRWAYLYDYTDILHITHALLNICKQLWKFDITEAKKAEIAAILTHYTENSLTDYLDIFEELEDKLVNLE